MNDRLDSDEVIKAHNEGRLQTFIAAYLRRQFKAKFVGRHNTRGLHVEMRGLIRRVVRDLEHMGIIDPNVNDVDVHTDDELDHFFSGDGAAPDPSLVHVNVGDRKMLLRLILAQNHAVNSD